MEIQFERDGTVTIDYNAGNDSITSLIGQKSFEGRVEEFNNLAQRRANDPSLEEEY